MKIASLEPFLTEIIAELDLGDSLSAVSQCCDYPEFVKKLPRATGERKAGSAGKVVESLSGDQIQLEVIAQTEPDLVLTSFCTGEGRKIGEQPPAAAALEAELSQILSKPVRVRSYYPRRLEEVWEVFEHVGSELGAGSKGRDLAYRCKARLLDWIDNFYERMRNKRVSLLSAVEPFRLAGYWVPDIIEACSCLSHEPAGGGAGRLIGWEEIQAFRPDVLVVAPQGFSLKQAMQTFKTLEQLPGWENLSAVKRGEVFFCDGQPNFYRPGPRLIDSVGILISAMAGFDSGYITKRDSFYRLRWLEMQRHRL